MSRPADRRVREHGNGRGIPELGVVGFNQFADKMPALAMLDQPFLLNFEALINAAFAPGSELRAVIDKTLLDTMGVRVPGPVARDRVRTAGVDGTPVG